MYKRQLPRSVILQDGEGHYIDSSRDQYTMFVYGAYRYVHSDICESREREALARVLTGFARRAEQNVTKENGYDLRRDDGGNSLNCVMWGNELGNHEYCRLPAIYLAAWDISGEEHWLELYRKIREEAYRKSLPMTEYWHLYTLQQMQAALYVCREADPDWGWKQKYDVLDVYKRQEQYDATYNSIKEQKTNHGLHFLRKNIIGNVYCDIKVSI